MSSSIEAAPSPEYAKFLKTYQEFLQHYTDCQKITGLMREPCTVPRASLPELFAEALQAHIKATDSHKKAIEAYQDFRQKVLTDVFNQCSS